MTRSPFPVIIVSGPPGAGKTTVASELARHFDRSVHLVTDFYYHSIRVGFIEPWKAEAAHQNGIAVRAAARSAVPYAVDGYVTILDGVVLPWALQLYRDELAREELKARCVVLLPSVEEVLQRGLSRGAQYGQDAATYREMHRQFAAAFEGSNEPVLNETISVEATVDAILVMLGVRDGLAFGVDSA